MCRGRRASQDGRGCLWRTAAWQEARTWEIPLRPLPIARLSIKRDRGHILFGGTKLLQTNGDASARLRAPDKGCLAVVLRTGYGTAQGGMMEMRWRCWGLCVCMASTMPIKSAMSHPLIVF